MADTNPNQGIESTTSQQQQVPVITDHHSGDSSQSNPILHPPPPSDIGNPLSSSPVIESHTKIGSDLTKGGDDDENKPEHQTANPPPPSQQQTSLQSQMEELPVGHDKEKEEEESTQIDIESEVNTAKHIDSSADLLEKGGGGGSGGENNPEQVVTNPSSLPQFNPLQPEMGESLSPSATGGLGEEEDEEQKQSTLVGKKSITKFPKTSSRRGEKKVTHPTGSISDRGFKNIPSGEGEEDQAMQHAPKELELTFGATTPPAAQPEKLDDNLASSSSSVEPPSEASNNLLLGQTMTTRTDFEGLSPADHPTLPEAPRIASESKKAFFIY